MGRQCLAAASFVSIAVLAAGGCSGELERPPPLLPDGPCGQGAKSCGGACVGVADPLYGCRAESCEPCAAWKSSLLVCRDGACALEQCRPSWSDCDQRFDDGCETDLLDPMSCGGCATVCPESESCSKRGCGSCQGKEVACSRRCVDVESDPDNCGVCGNVCPSGPGAVAKCKDRVCRVNCDEGYGDCDGDPTNGCEPLAPYYRDADGDGYGIDGKVGRSCVPPPGHASRAGDCNDGDPRVHPGQLAFFPVGYVKDGAGTESFDYDCDGVETVAPDAALGTCAASVCRPGAAPGAARGGATNAYCGSSGEFRCTLGPAACSTSPRSAVGCR